MLKFLLATSVINLANLSHINHPNVQAQSIFSNEINKERRYGQRFGASVYNDDEIGEMNCGGGLNPDNQLLPSCLFSMDLHKIDIAFSPVAGSSQLTLSGFRSTFAERNK